MICLCRFLLYCSLGLLLGLPQQTSAAEEGVKDVRFWSQDNKVHVSYTLVGKGVYNVTLHMSDDGGKTFAHRPRSVSGDVGERMRPGPDKKIVWDALDEVEQLDGDSYAFRVRAVRSLKMGKWPWIAGAGAAGAAAFVISKGGEEKGEIVIEVPDPEGQE